MTDLKIALAGNPNCGKTTLFNALTGSSQRVGNWPGVTVERKMGSFTEKNTRVEVVDLPGAYSLTVAAEDGSIDECIARDYLLQQEVDVIVNVLDASNLERNLYLTMQLLAMNVPMVLAVNMMDVARQRGMQISLTMLEQWLGCPVVALEANKAKGIKALKQVLTTRTIAPPQPIKNKFILPIVEQALADLSQQTQSAFIALRLLEGDVGVAANFSPKIKTNVMEWQQRIQVDANEDADIMIADARYRFIESLIAACITQATLLKKTWTSRIDSVVLNRFAGIPIFLSMMYFLFFFAINIGGAFQDFFDISSNTIFVQGFAHILTQVNTPAWLTALLADGVGKGINTTITFIPVIGAMFLFLAFLEDSGYMARAAFVIDRLMQVLGLPGKSFVPMVVGFGCNVPSVMAARTLENKRDRILTVMMSPFMSCGARLAIYAVFVAAFFPVGGQNVIFVLYLIGIIMAMLTGFMLRKTLLQGDSAPLVMELPPYRVPRIKTLFLHAWQRLKGFVFRAGKLIVPICILIGALNAINVDGSLNNGDGSTHSLLSTAGRMLTPIFAPMGIQQDNWPATVGLVTGVLAKEVVVGTLNTLYSQLGHLALVQDGAFHFWDGISAAILSIPQNLAQLGQSLANPVLATAPAHTLSQAVYGVMYQQFDGQIGAIAYLLFVLLYFPCVSTTAVMLREVNRGWTVFSVLWTTGMAYCVAVAFYQAATFMRHPLSSAIWLAAIASVMILVMIIVRMQSTGTERGAYEFA